MQSMLNLFADNLRVIKGSWYATIDSLSNRILSELFNLLPSISFFIMQGVTVFSLFRVINGVETSWVDLLIFIGIMICVDGCGDSLFLAGIHEYCSSLVRGQTVYYLLTPGTPLLKIFFFRMETTKFSFCAIIGLATIVFAAIERGGNLLLALIVLVSGILTHMVLTSAFHIIQAYWDPTRPIRLGSPATKFYTRPIHMVMSSIPLQLILILLYPAYFCTAFPSVVASKNVPAHFPFSLGTAFALGMTVLVVWCIGLNYLIKKSCVKYQN